LGGAGTAGTLLTAGAATFPETKTLLHARAAAPLLVGAEAFLGASLGALLGAFLEHCWW